MRPINKIIVHESASKFGDAATIDRWHRESNRWSQIGYHFVILNGFRYTGESSYCYEDDGYIEEGRPVEKIGAHCRGENLNSIGICLIGHRTFTYKQLFLALPDLIHKLLMEYDLEVADVYGHCEFTDYKTCPDMDMDSYRDFLELLKNG